MPSLAGKVAIVTGAGRGIGREHALALARAGAKIVVNDLGTSLGGEGTDLLPADEVVEEIGAAGGKAVADYENVADFAGAERMVAHAVEAFGRLDILVNNAGIIARPDAREHDRGGVGRRHRRPSQGHFAPTRHAAAYWREQSKAGLRCAAA